MFTTEEAESFRLSYDSEVKFLSKRSHSGLVDIEARLMRGQGMKRVYGSLSKDELISSILNLRGFSNAKLNESIHVLYHTDGLVNECCDSCTHQTAEGNNRG